MIAKVVFVYGPWIYFGFCSFLWLLGWTLGFKGSGPEMLWKTLETLWISSGDATLTVVWNGILLLLWAFFALGVGIVGVCMLGALVPLAAVAGIGSTGPFGLLVAVAIVILACWLGYRKLQKMPR